MQSKAALNGWTIVFDLDGTLVESAPDLLGALNHCLAREHIPPVALADIRTMIGQGAKAMITEGLRRAGKPEPTPDHMDRLWHDFIDYYRAHIADESHVFAGAIDALDALEAHGARLAVCTNKTQALADQVLSELVLAERFRAIVGADSVRDRKPHGGHILATVNAAGGDATRAIMVGDSRTDERAARNAGLPFIFVPFGYEDASADEIQADGVVNHYSELLRCVLALAG